MKLRLRSQRVVQDVGAAAEVDKNEGLEMTQSNWTNLPSELLTLVLEKIEQEESKWPARKHVVACAGVCKCWREILKELVKPPVLSGSLTFPISVKQPGPKDNLLQCFIRRKHSSQTYHLYLSLNQALADDGKFILTARKCRRTTCTEYIISLLTDDMMKGSKSYIGKLRSNFLGTKFVVYDALPPSGASTTAGTGSQAPASSNQAAPRAIAGNYPVSHISYELNVLGARRGPRRMHVIMDPIPATSVKPDGVAPTQLEFPVNSSADHFSMFRSRSSRLEKSMSGPLSENEAGEKPLVLKNKNPRWHEQLQCWCLNFHGRVTVASVKNFQLVASPEGGEPGPEHEKVIVQFGKVGKDVFTMDYRYPLSAFQAFAICLSSFDTKIACE